MPMLKYGHAVLATPIVDPFKWVDKKVPAGRVKVARSVIAKYDPSKWLLSHVTIIASVDTDLADPSDKKSNYLIKPEHSIFVNNNGDSWERELLKATYKTFLGADNFCEHVQIPELSKGKVIDVALREVPIGKDIDGKDLTTLYVDILVATNRNHTELVEKIKCGDYSAMSMGCLIAYSFCSQCGNKAEDESKLCKHIRYFKRNHFIDKNGVKRIVAELCGSADDPDSCKFIDASWVKKPAFGGALLRNLVEPNDDISEKLNKAMLVPSFQPQPGMLLRAASQAAASLVNEIQAQDEKPEEGPTEDAKEPAKDDTDFPAAPEGDAPLNLDEPAPEAPAEAAPSPVPEAQPEPQIQEPAEDATVKEVEQLFTKNILNKIRRKLLKEEAGVKTPPEERPLGTESTNSNLIKDASKIDVIKLAKMSGNERLLNGFMILSNIKNWNSLKKYGYCREDVLGMLHFIDKNISSDPVGSDAVLALSNIKTACTDPQSFFTDMIIEIGRQPSISEGRRLIKWAKILSKI